MQICAECGQAFDGDQCLGCVPRKAGVDKTVFWSFVAALAGMILTSFAQDLYPPLGWDPPARSLDLTFFALTFALVMLHDRLAQYITFVRAMCVLASAATLILAAFFFLNGALDEHPPVEADALVSTKYVSRRYAERVLVLSIAWNQRRIEETLSVSRETFSVVEPGDSVRVVVHPGAFSTPWYGKSIDKLD